MSENIIINSSDVPIAGNPVKPINLIGDEYRKSINKLILAMIKDIKKGLVFQYGAVEGDVVYAHDESPTERLTKWLNKRFKYWQGRVDIHADKIANSFINNIDNHSKSSLDANFKKLIKDFTIRKSCSRRFSSILSAKTKENVDLITNIPEQMRQQITGDVQRCISNGRNLKEMQQLIIQRGITAESRVKLIAKDQLNKATSAINTARALDNGIRYGIWRHSSAGREPRHSHVIADGTIFDLSKGLFIDGKWIMPSEEINCRCYWVPLLSLGKYKIGDKYLG